MIEKRIFLGQIMIASGMTQKLVELTISKEEEKTCASQNKKRVDLPALLLVRCQICKTWS